MLRSGLALSLVLAAGCDASTRSIGGGGGGGGGSADAGAGVDGGGGGDTGGVNVRTDDLARAYAKHSACTGNRIDDEYLDSRLTRARAQGMPRTLFDQLVSCLANAGDCAAVLRCQGYAPDQMCDPDTFTKRCESGRDRVECDELDNGMKIVQRTECGGLFASGSICAVHMDGYLSCYDGMCGADGSRCAGAVVEQCSGGRLYRNDCATVGATCISSPDFGARCGIAGGSCTTDTCDGNTAVDCASGLVRARTDCNALVPGFVCVMSGDSAQCARPGGTEQCQGDEVRCEGNIARACANGQWFDFDCGAWNGGTCQTAGSGVRCKIAGWP